MPVVLLVLVEPDPLLLAALFAWVGYSTAGDAAGRKWWHLAVDAVALLWCAAFARSRFRALRLDPLALRAELRAEAVAKLKSYEK